MDSITALTQQLDPLRPLAADETDLYVDWQKELLGNEDLKPRLVREIARSGSTPITRLLTGHRGTGKTTELYRVQKMLAEKKVFVSFLECEEWVDLNDVGPPDLMLQMVRQLVSDLKQEGYGLGFEKVMGYFGKLGEILNSVELKDLALGPDFIKIGMAIKQVPGARAALRKLLEDRLPNIYHLVNEEILGPAREWLRKEGFEDILIIVDQLDRTPQKQINDHGLTNHEQFFLNSSGVLRALKCDVIYTIPIELAYSHCHGRLMDAYGGEIATLPMITVDDRGIKLLREIVQRRAAAAGTSVEAMFTNLGDLDRICRLSGGHVRSLFTLLRAALNRSDALPLSGEIVELAVRRQASDFSKSLNAGQWEALGRVHASHNADEDHTRWMTFLRERYVYAYYDPQADGLWYDWNPLLAEAKR